jgi:transcriptional regulator with XRE-family HTH domain
MTSEMPLAEVITANVRAQRVRMKLKQADVAARMQAFGLRWHYQTVGAVERGERPLTAEELLWLSICLLSTPAVLVQPQSDAVTSPSGRRVRAQRLNTNDDSVTFDGNVPVISAEPGKTPMPEQRIAELEHLAEHLAEYAREVRRQAHREPAEGGEPQGEVGSQEGITGAVDIPPRRPGKPRGRRSR